jgi:hypothetical protein
MGVEYEYGNRIRLSEEAHGPDRFVVQENMPEALARAYAAESKHVTLVRRVKTEWEEVYD